MSEYTILMEQKSTSTGGVANLLWKYKLTQLFKDRFFLVFLGVTLINLFYFTLLSVVVLIFFLIYIFGGKIYLAQRYKEIREATIYQYLDGNVHLRLNELGFGFGKKQASVPRYPWKDFSSYTIFREPGILLVRSPKFKTSLILYKSDMKTVDFEVLISFVQHYIKKGIIVR